MALRIKYFIPQQLFLVNMYFANVLENRGFTITKYWQKTTKLTQDQVHWINTPEQKETERETGKPDTILQRLTEIRKLQVWRLSFPYFNKKQGRIWRTTDTKTWYQFFCVFEKQLILWNHLKVCTSTCAKKGRSCLKNVLEFFHYIIDLVDKAETMDRVYCICISGKYLIFYYTRGRFAELESVLQTHPAAVVCRALWHRKQRVPGKGSGAGRRRDKQEGAAGSDLVPLLFTL